MRKFLSILGLLGIMVTPSFTRANDLVTDTSDPLFLQGIEEILSTSSISYWDHILGVGQSLSYGMNNRLAIGANVRYQHEFNGTEDGFDAIDLGGVYSVGNDDDND